MALYSLPSDIISDGATVSWQVGTAVAGYPLTNAYDRLAHTVAKITQTSGTMRFTFGAGKTLQAVAVINTNATAITLTSNGGANVAFVIPSTPGDTLRLDPWVDLRGSPPSSATQWELAFTAATGVTVGEVLLVQTLRDLNILWAPNPSDKERHPVIVQRTDGQVKWKYGLGERARGFRGMVRGEDVKADLLALERDARGLQKNFLLIPQDEVNDALFVDLTTDLREFVYAAPGVNAGPTTFSYVHDLALEFEEQQKGII